MAHRDGDHAVAKARGRRPVREDVPQVAVATGANQLGAVHAMRGVQPLAHGPGQRLGERRPPRAGLELDAGLVERVTACGAHVRARVLGPHVTAHVRRLGAALAQHLVLLGRQTPPPLFFAQVEYVSHGTSLGRTFTLTIVTLLGRGAVAWRLTPCRLPGRRPVRAAVRADPPGATPASPAR